MRIILIGGPARGKSTLAETYHKDGYTIYCGDPLSFVKHPNQTSTYRPEDLAFSGNGGAADWIVKNWFPLPSPWICEGHVMARALRRWARENRDGYPCDKIIVMDRKAFVETTPAQEAMHKGVIKVWKEIEYHFLPISEILTK